MYAYIPSPCPLSLVGLRAGCVRPTEFTGRLYPFVRSSHPTRFPTLGKCSSRRPGMACLWHRLWGRKVRGIGFTEENPHSFRTGRIAMKLGRQLVALALLGLASMHAEAASAGELGLRTLGLRAGISMNPDQFHGGVFADVGQIVSKVRLQPSFEFGLGNGVRLGAVNADALYLFDSRRWRPYAGGGLGINFIDVTDGVGQGDGMDIEPVFNLVAGVEWGNPKPGSRASRRYQLEARLGLGDTPDFKLSAGITF